MASRRTPAALKQLPNGEPPAPPAASARRSGTDTVTMACKYPQGLILRIFAPTENRVPVLGQPGNMVVETLHKPVGTSHRIWGPSTPMGQAPRCLIVDGYAMTSGVPRELAEKWMEQNAQSRLVREHLVFIASTDAEAQAEAHEYAATRSGYEPLDPSTEMRRVGGKQVSVPVDPRWTRPSSPNVTNVATDTREG